MRFSQVWVFFSVFPLFGKAKLFKLLRSKNIDFLYLSVRLRALAQHPEVYLASRILYFGRL